MARPLTLREQLKQEGYYRVSEAALKTGIPPTTIYDRLLHDDSLGKRVGASGEGGATGRKGKGVWYVLLSRLQELFGQGEKPS